MDSKDTNISQDVDSELKSKTSLGTYISYAFGAFGHDAFYATLSSYFIMFVTSYLFMKPDGTADSSMIGIVTLIIFIVRIVELTIDPVMGGLIDNTKSKWGKFKPWIIVGGLVSSVTLSILFTDIWGLSSSQPLLYLVVFALLYIVMDVFYSIKDIGFWSMIPALSFDAHEREKLGTVSRVGSTLGATVVTMTVMPIVLCLTNVVGSGKTAWGIFAMIIATLSFVSIFCTAIFAKEKDNFIRSNTEKVNLIKVFKILAKNDQLMWLSLAYILYCLGNTLTQSLILYYFNYILGRADAYWLVGVITAIVGFLAVVSFPVLTRLASRKKIFTCCILIYLVAEIVFALAGTNLVLVLLAVLLAYAPTPVIFLVVLMTISDCVEYGQYKIKTRNEAVTLSVRPLIDKLAGAVVNGVVGLTAIICGMTGAATASDITSTGSFVFKIFMVGIPFVLFLVSLLVFNKKVTLTESVHADIVEKLAEELKKEKANK